MMPLTLAKQGETVTIRKITGKDEIRQHLAELGFVVDGTVTVVSELGGNLIVQVKDSRIALDRTMANRVMIWRQNMKTLRDAKVGDTVTVVKLHGEGAVKRRIMDMGITKGVALHVRKVAPLGDPMELNVRGYELSVRKADAEMIEIA